jgi:hypothetical protein
MFMKKVTPADLGNVAGLTPNAQGVDREVYFGNYRVAKKGKHQRGVEANVREAEIFTNASTRLKQFLPNTYMTKQNILSQELLGVGDSDELTNAIVKTFPKYSSIILSLPQYQSEKNMAKRFNILWTPLWMLLVFMKRQQLKGIKDDTLIRKTFNRRLETFRHEFGQDLTFLSNVSLDISEARCLMELPLETLVDIHANNIGWCLTNHNLKFLDFAGSTGNWGFLDDLP